MAHHDHGPNDTGQLDNAQTAARNARFGLWLFAAYLLLYGGFVFLNAFAPQRMEAPAVAGVNLAVTYGMGLIAAAFLLALLYGWLCRLPVEDETAASLQDGAQ